MRHKKISGIIIGIKPLQEFDRTITVFSHEYGRTRIVAKGVRKISSQRGFHLDLLNSVNMEIEVSARGILYLREIETTEYFKKIKADPLKFAVSNIIASFLSCSIPEESPQKKLFELTYKTLTILNRSEPDAQNALSAKPTEQGWVAKHDPAISNPRQTLYVYLLKAMRLLGYLPQKMPKHRIGDELITALENLSPQLTLTARRTLGIFSMLDKTRSS